MRAIWKGHIRFSLVTIPIRIYNAVETARTIRFNQLHKTCNGPVGYDKKCKKCSKVLDREEIVKGYQHEPEQFVIVESEDLEKIKLKGTRIIEIEGFVDASEVHPTLYETPYFAGPDGEVAAQAYALLSAALKASGKLGIGKVVLRDREEIVTIGPEGDGLIFYKLRTPERVRSISDVPQLSREGADAEQMKLARSLVDSMSTSLDRIDLKDNYRQAVQEMLEAKIEGREIVTVAEEVAPVVDIMTALKESIAQAKADRKPMKKATGKARPETKAARKTGTAAKARKRKVA